MPDELNLSLPDRDRARRPSPRAVPTLLAILVILGTANLVVTLLRSPRGQGAGSPAALGPEAEKDLALKLGKQGLRSAAAQAWRRYLDSADLSDAERARIWYRIGQVHQEAGDYEPALDAFYRSESCAVVDELADEIGRRSQECLEALGKFAALRYHLAERVQIGADATAPGDAVVAEIGKQKITKARLDEMLEEQIDQQLTRFAAFMPPEERRKQKEAMLQRFASAEQRKRMLEQFIAGELLYRKAREAKLADDEAVRALLHETEKQVLAQQALARELADQIKITAVDLENHYNATKAKYVQPARARIRHILVKDDAAAAAARARLTKGEAFADVAKALSTDEATKAKGGEVSGWVDKGGYIPGIGTSDDATAAIFTTEAGKVAEKNVKTDKGLHIIQVAERQPERQKSFDEVRPEVFRDLRGRKEAEVQQRLLDELKDRYNVVIHTSVLDKKPEGGDGEPPAKKDDKGKAAK